RDFADNGAAQNLFFDESGDVFTVESGGKTIDNPLFWLTTYGEATDVEAHAARARLVPLSADRYVVLWERWLQSGMRETFDGTYALEIDAAGSIITPEARVSDSEIPRGDDAFALGGQAALVFGSAAD